MRKIRDVFHLKFALRRSIATIAQDLQIGKTTIEEYLARARNEI